MRSGNMQIALIGGTGGMGTFVLEELVLRHHEVKAVVRRPNAVPATALVTPVRADAYDEPELTKALAGADVVVSAFNPGWDEPGLYDKYLRGARNVQEAAVTAGAGRLLVVGGASSLYGEDGRQLIESFTPPEPYASGVRAARDYYEELRAETRLDWTYLSPPMNCGPLGPDGRTGRYRAGTDRPVVDADGKSSLSRQDLAVAVVDEIERPAHLRQRFTVGY
jgi:putative NADH-flavin reductase